MTVTYTGVFERVGRYWIAYAEELPGANTQGETLEEARENLVEAIQLIIETNRAFAREESRDQEVIREEVTVSV